MLKGFVLGVLLTGVVVIAAMSMNSSGTAQSASKPEQQPSTPSPAAETKPGHPANLHELLALSPEQLEEVDIARMNLLCAEGLPGAENLDIDEELLVLDLWAGAVHRETERLLYKYFDDPGNYENSQGYFRILTLITVLQQDFNVVYNPERIFQPDFTDCRDVFLHGLTQASSQEQHSGGTCVSMPVVYVAVARRLGYPVKLVTTKQHVFARWEDENERFNIEATGQGLGVYEDEHYTKWPLRLSNTEVESGTYLRSLSPAEELGVFMAARGYVLEDTGKKREATIAYAYAHALDHKAVDSFDNLAGSVLRRISEYPVLQERLPTPRRVGSDQGTVSPIETLVPPRNPGKENRTQ